MPEKFSIDEFAEKIKAKYPVYAGLSNADLAGKVLAKYPQYRANIIPAGRQEASKSEFEKNRPAFEKPEGYSALEAPLDVGIGIEKAIGLDPMHPIASSPAAAKAMLSGIGNLVAHPIDTVTGLASQFGGNVQAGGKALREGNLSEAFQNVGGGYALAEPAVEGVGALKKPTIAALRAAAKPTEIPEMLRNRAEINRAPLPWGSHYIAKRAATVAAGYALGEPRLGEAAVAADVLRHYQPYRNLKANLLERTANLLGGPGEPNFRGMEEKIAPSGRLAQKASQIVDASGQVTPFGRELASQVPELLDAPKGPKADAALMSGYQRVLQRVNETENAVPPNTTVDRIAISSQLGDLHDEYVARGLPQTAEKIKKVWEQWDNGSQQIPWSEFIRQKRNFFQEHNLKSAPMRRAYGVLMGASERAAPSLTPVNRAYSTVRRALDNAGIDVTTGRRLSKVGKQATIEEIKQRQSLKSKTTRISQPSTPKPVQNRQEALDLLSGEEPEE